MNTSNHTNISHLFFFFLFCFQVDSVDGKTVKVTKNVLPCTLDEATKDLIQLIFSNDMFKEAMECMNLGGCGSHKQVHEFCKHTTCMSSPVGWLHVSTHILVFSSRIIIIIIVIFLYIYLEYPVHTIIQRILFSSFVPVLNFYLGCAAFSQVYTLIVFYLFIYLFYPIIFQHRVLSLSLVSHSLFVGPRRGR